MFIFGGRSSSKRLGDFWVLDIDIWQWSELASFGDLPSSRDFATASTIGNRKIVMYGGWDGKKWLSDVYILDIMLLEWIELSVSGSFSVSLEKDISFNALFGDIPFSISKLKELEFLILKNNQLIGPIPSTLSQIPNLKVLDLSYNELTGEIPFNIGFLQVATFNLSSNNLRGPIPIELSRIGNLDTLYDHSLGHVVYVVIFVLLFHFLITGAILATCCWFLTNNYLREEVPNSHVVEQRVEWLYAFDVHCNSFFPMFVLLYVVHYFLSPLLIAHGFISVLLSNLLFMVAVSYYHYLNFLGYDDLCR